MHSRAMGRLVAVALSLAALGILLSPSHASTAEESERLLLKIRLEQMEAGSGFLWTDFSLFNALQGTTRDDLHHGRPLTFLYTVELWKQRSHWFDGLIASRTLEVRLRY